MSWTGLGETLDVVLAASPAAASLGEYVRAVRDDPETDRDLLDRCAARMAFLLGVPTESVAMTATTPREEAAIAFAEQWVMDASGVTEDDTERLRKWLTDAECTAFTQGLSVTEALLRVRLVLGVDA